MQEPRVSICITTQRFDIFFRRAVHSIKNQSVAPFEVVLVVDGFSEQMSGHNWFKDLPEEWVKLWTEQGDSGPSYARNIGMHACQGDWILILDGDDFLVPSCLEFYNKYLSVTKTDLIVEFNSLTLTHYNLQVARHIPANKIAWQDIVKTNTKAVFSGSWKKGVLPIHTLFVRNEGKKYYPLDYYYMEGRVFIMQYMLEERKILLSDYCGYVVNIHPGTLTAIHGGKLYGSHPDELRFKRMASNIQINGWTAKEKIFEPLLSSTFLTSWDIEYIDSTISYLTFQ